jgi:hypothetical protein
MTTHQKKTLVRDLVIGVALTAVAVATLVLAPGATF